MNQKALSFSLKYLSEITSSQILGDPDFLIYGIEDIKNATPTDITFLENHRYAKFLSTSSAGAIILSSKQMACEGKNYLINSHPTVAFQQIIELFLGSLASDFEGIHATAIIDSSATVASGVIIEPYVVISKNVSIGTGSRIGAGTFIGRNSKIGENCVLYPNVTIRENVILGNRVFIQPGVVIGSCGFGYTIDNQGNYKHLKQLGTVILEDEVEIGANTTIDRGRFKVTHIGKGTKIDNLVQVGHHVSIGSNSMIVSQTGVAGSTTIGNRVTIGGQVGIAGHLSICDLAVITAKTGLAKSILTPDIWGGIPGRPHKENMSHQAQYKKIPRLEKRVLKLEELIKQVSLTNSKS